MAPAEERAPAEIAFPRGRVDAAQHTRLKEEGMYIGIGTLIVIILLIILLT